MGAIGRGGVLAGACGAKAGAARARAAVRARAAEGVERAAGLGAAGGEVASRARHDVCAKARRVDHAITGDGATCRKERATCRKERAVNLGAAVPA